ncbi:hypothetical protein ACFOQM_01780 [Paenibacillus sp. GCM10012307]|uniref:Uncharacterized protein n=1 Tax=Paenibacillus roseus TaxID=2798579 RepID=A0A934J1W0_9BACL|nr:hypothetical protein [Paenibacillus roseus]MBJ6360049.1 hypothetical protein [Paenibacillus roseus]
MGKKLLLVLMCYLLLLVSSNSVFAANSPSGKNNVPAALNKVEQEEVEKLLDQLVQSRLLKDYYRKQSKNLQVQELDDQEKLLWKQLNNRGAKLATQEELNTISQNSTPIGGMSTFMSNPPSWGPYSRVDMLSFGTKSITVSGKSYTIWIFYAIPKDGGGAPLAKFFNTIDLNNNNSFSMSTFSSKMFNIYLQKVVGMIPFLAWTPFEYFWPEGNNYTSFNRYDFSVTYASRMKYVWQYLPNDTWQLKASSNNVSLSEVHTARGIKNGSANSISKVVNNVVYADQYSNVETLAITSSFYSTWPVDTIVYKNVSGGNALSFFPFYASSAPDLM